MKNNTHTETCCIMRNNLNFVKLSLQHIRKYLGKHFMNEDYSSFVSLLYLHLEWRGEIILQEVT